MGEEKDEETYSNGTKRFGFHSAGIIARGWLEPKTDGENTQNGGELRGFTIKFSHRCWI